MTAEELASLPPGRKRRSPLARICSYCGAVNEHDRRNCPKRRVEEAILQGKPSPSRELPPLCDYCSSPHHKVADCFILGVAKDLEQQAKELEAARKREEGRIRELETAWDQAMMEEEERTWAQLVKEEEARLERIRIQQIEVSEKILLFKWIYEEGVSIDEAVAMFSKTRTEIVGIINEALAHFGERWGIKFLPVRDIDLDLPLSD
jgi:hypothetical protein